MLYKFNHAVTRRLIMGEGTTMKFIMLVVFALGNNVTSTQVGNKTYAKIEECLAAAEKAKFSTPNPAITAVAWCAPQ